MTQEMINPQVLQQTVPWSPTLKNLRPLVGEWNTKITIPGDPEAPIFGLTAFEWLPGEFFLVQHWDVAGNDFPKGIAVIGWSATTENFTMHYYDSRGVSRIYEMTLNSGIWKLWRIVPGFSQRFMGTITDNGNTILGSWEKSVDNSHWEQDFDISYTKVKTANNVQALPIENQEKLTLVSDPAAS